ncbi:MAG: SCP2 sterol-binding domain-containing protein [Acidimicrobiales bacterium]
MDLYSPEWISAFNDVVSHLPSDPDVSFRMVQVVRDAQGGTFEIALDVREGRVRMASPPEEGPAPEVTVSISYADALALSSGETDPSTLLTHGKVRVRGDLSVLVRANAIMAEAAGRLSDEDRPATTSAT